MNIPPRSFTCKSCGSTSGMPLVDLGLQPLANNLLRAEDLDRVEPRFPLRLGVCRECWLMQIEDLVPPIELFSEYLYFSSFSEAMLRHAATAAARYRDEFGLGPQNLVMEIASNDGYLLKNFVAGGIPVLGIEPAANVAAVAIDGGIPTITEFFGLTLARRLVAEGRRADLILGNNVFAHVPTINDFVAGLGVVLQPGGRIVLEFPYGGDFVTNCEFDTVYHEHVFYFFLTPLLDLFERHGLEIFHVERIPIHGGSLRLFAGHPGSHAIRSSVVDLLREEISRGVRSEMIYRDFHDRVETIRRQLLALLADIRRQGQTIACYGASAKGSTLLNFIAPPHGTFEFIADRSTYKQGRFSPGLHLPILPAEQLAVRKPDYALLLTWNFAEEILAQQQAYRRDGGKFILPIPEVRVI